MDGSVGGIECQFEKWHSSVRCGLVWCYGVTHSFGVDGGVVLLFLSVIESPNCANRITVIHILIVMAQPYSNVIAFKLFNFIGITFGRMMRKVCGKFYQFHCVIGRTKSHSSRAATFVQM